MPFLAWLFPTWIKWALIAAVIAGLNAAFFVWRASIRTEAKREVQVEQTAKQIEKLSNARKSEDRVRRRHRAVPDSLHENDGFRRD